MMTGSNGDLRKAYRLTVFIGLAMLASLLVYAIVVEMLKQQHAPFSGFAHQAGGIEALRFALLGVAAVEFFLIRVVNKAMLSGRRMAGNPGTAGSGAPVAQRLVSASVVTYALCESLAIYGLVLFLIQGISGDFYLFLVLSLFSFSSYFPKYSTWKQWVKGREREGASNRKGR